jgi:nucleotide-binding universal stress UspA family protein
MQFKSILTMVAEPDRARHAIDVAARMARLHDGHLDVVALGFEMMQPEYSYVGAGVAMADWSMDEAQADARAAELAARTILGEQEPGLRFGLETVVAISGQLSALIAERAAYSDLVVQTSPAGKAARGLADAIIEAALFDGKAPVLIVPDTVDIDKVVAPRRVVLAWNQSAEALNAAKRALPLLQSAEMVSVTVIDPPLSGAERSDPGGPLCQFLARHGVKVEASVLTRNRSRIAEVLAQHALDYDADLLVMGAYGHSRLREAILGGATRDVLNETRLPVFLVH